MQSAPSPLWQLCSLQLCTQLQVHKHMLAFPSPLPLHGDEVSRNERQCYMKKIIDGKHLTCYMLHLRLCRENFLSSASILIKILLHHAALPLLQSG